MIIKIPFKTPSVNHLYGHRGAIMFLTKEAKELREKIAEIVRDQQQSPDIPTMYNKPLKVTTYIYEDWYCKNGSIKRVDVANREKFLIDSVFNALGIDDKFIFEHTMIKKREDLFLEENKAVVEVTPL